MNILFLTMNIFKDINMHNIYADLMKELIKHGHRPYIVTPRERKTGEKTKLADYEEYSLLKVQTGNSQNVSIIEKGITTIMLSGQYYHAAMKYLRNIEFGLILYSTPPITLAEPVRKLRKYYKCNTYLMLKDIFPQNAVDLKIFSDNGLIYKYFRYKEKKLYKVSNRIGCMSAQNKEYLIKHNQYLDKKNIEICPNAIIPQTLYLDHEEKLKIRQRYNIPESAVCFMYGGNLGKPQGIPFLIECLKAQNNEEAFFVICGTGEYYDPLKQYFDKENPTNAMLIKWLPKQEYDHLLKACDVGLIFLDHRFTIPNFPSRMLSYMENAMPILACTDVNTDIGDIITEGKFGWWCESNDVDGFCQLVKKICNRKLIGDFGANSRLYLESNYLTEKVFEKIMQFFC